MTLRQASLPEGILHHLDLKTHRECSVDGETLHAKLYIKNLMQYIFAVCHLVCSVHIKLITCLSIMEEGPSSVSYIFSPFKGLFMEFSLFKSRF